MGHFTSEILCGILQILPKKKKKTLLNVICLEFILTNFKTTLYYNFLKVNFTKFKSFKSSSSMKNTKRGKEKCTENTIKTAKKYKIKIKKTYLSIQPLTRIVDVGINNP